MKKYRFTYYTIKGDIKDKVIFASDSNEAKKLVIKWSKESEEFSKFYK